MDEAGARGRLAKPPATPGGKFIPLNVGDVLDINDKRATVVGVPRGTPTFQSQPILYTTYNLAKNYALSERKLLTYILVKAKADESPRAVALARERYRKGLTIFLDLLTAENSLYTAQSNLSKSEANLLTDLTPLYKALGGGWDAADVRVAVGQVTPETKH